MDNIAKLREKIDEIDDKILRLLRERTEVSKLIGEIKRKKGMPIRDQEREREKYTYVLRKAAELGLSLEAVRSIYQKIIEMSIQAQEQNVQSV
ncbi:MAG: chorismate mutase [Candidatus Bathyarchaeia archaeon]